MLNHDFLNALIGGIFIGLAASGMMWSNGRVMGVSGILGGLLAPKTQDILWRGLFVAGLVLGSFFIPRLGFSILQTPFDRGLMAAVAGGLLVGVGTTLGNGCTSGHGVCGISRFSTRSLAATAVFMAFGIITVGIIRNIFGGLS
jgi:uncharacterized membrane protein YedE/YeeE